MKTTGVTHKAKTQEIKYKLDKKVSRTAYYCGVCGSGVPWKRNMFLKIYWTDTMLHAEYVCALCNCATSTSQPITDKERKVWAKWLRNTFKLYNYEDENSSSN